jgi:preprotein translocase subunit SecD
MSDYFDRVERQLVERTQLGRPQAPNLSGYLAMVAAVIVAIVVAGAFLLARGTGGPGKPPADHGNVSVVLSARPPHQSASILDRAVVILRQRLRAVFPDAQVTRSGKQIVVNFPSRSTGVPAEIRALTAPGRLGFYDWEGDVIAPDGRSVAKQLLAGNPAALEISQGNGSAAPGEPEAGGLSVHEALALVPKASVGGPYAVVRAIAPSARDATAPSAPGAKFFVLRGPPALTGTDVTDPRVSNDPSTGVPDVTFGFTAAGRRVFEAMTKEIARRGSEVSGLGQTLNQHFAIVLDDRLISVPFIDYKQYPDGINGDQGADIGGKFITQSARDLAILLRYGPLPVNLTATG